MNQTLIFAFLSDILVIHWYDSFQSDIGNEKVQCMMSQEQKYSKIKRHYINIDISVCLPLFVYKIKEKI